MKTKTGLIGTIVIWSMLVLFASCQYESKPVVQKVQRVIVHPNVQWWWSHNPGWYYRYRQPLLQPLGPQRWWYDTGQRCWWQYNVTPYNVTVNERRKVIPRAPKVGIDRYVDYGCPTGSFLRAVLSNDLFEAVAKADEYNKLALAEIVRYVYNYTPVTCYGSPERVEAWLKLHREKPEEANTAAAADRDRRENYYK